MFKGKLDFLNNILDTPEEAISSGFPNKIVLLAGTSCSGKTSIITELISYNLIKIYSDKLGNLPFLQLEELLNEGSKTLILSQNNIGIDYYERIIKKTNIKEDSIFQSLHKVCKYKQISSFSNITHLEKFMEINKIKYVFVDDFSFNQEESQDFLNFIKYCYNNSIFVLFSLNIRKPAEEMDNWHSIADTLINNSVLRICTHVFLVDLNYKNSNFKIHTWKNRFGSKDEYEFRFERI